jgi:SAM-dependent MidA family methyltransferase
MSSGTESDELLPSGRSAGHVLAERIGREGPIPFDAFVEGALYGDGGFFDRGRGAGRAGHDFVTSPEVGPLFAALVARALDGWWDGLGTPDPFFVVEAGAGRGRLAADLLASAPRCAPALRYLLVERSASLRDAQRDLLTLEPLEDAVGPTTVVDDDVEAVPVAGAGPIVASLAELPELPLDGLVLANELLDNLPFRLVERSDEGWNEVRVTLDVDSTAASGSGSPPGRTRGAAAAGDRPWFAEVLVPAAPELAAEADVVAGAHLPLPSGTRLPVPTGTRAWLREAARTIHRGHLVVVDYVATAPELLERGPDGWLRTYRDHARATSPLVAPGDQDITHDVPLEYLLHAAERAGWSLVRQTTQADWLASLGVDELVAEARAAWDERAHVGDLEALRHRSRVTEAAALTDPAGLGAHTVLVFTRRA